VKGEPEMDLNTLKNSAPWDWPVDAGEILIGIITSQQAGEKDRLVAVELAGDPVVGGDDVAGVLLQVAGAADESEAIRGAAAISLGTILEEADILDADDFGDEEDYITAKMFAKIQHVFKALFHDAGTPEEVRRSILEASVRAPQDWQAGAVRSAYIADDERWRLTAVFSMQYIRGFDQQILEALESDDPLVRYHAVTAAGNWEVDGAWRHIKGLITDGDTDTDMLLAAIDAVVSLRPGEAPLVLGDLLDSDDEDIVDAVHEALSMARGLSGIDDLDDV
jgi:HEAT repeat protein